MPFSFHDFAVHLTQDDLDAMPGSLRHAFDAWHAQRQVTLEQMGVSLNVPPRTSLDEIAREMLRVIAGMMPASDLGAWLDRFDAQPPRKGAMVRNPMALVSLAVAGRDLGLLNALLDRPGFCPDSPDTRLRALQQDATTRREGAESFNGSLHLAYGHATGHGMAVAIMAFHAITEASPDATPLMGPDDPLRVWCNVQQAQEERWNDAVQALLREPSGSTWADGFRTQNQTNIVGQAVLMGWPDGVQALLDHGVDPYANEGARHSFTSPLVLAGHYGELACAQALLAHGSVEIGRRFGRTEQEAANLARATMDSSRTLWNANYRTTSTPRTGGMELGFVLAHPVLVRDPQVQAQVLQRLSSNRGTRKRVLEVLSEDERRGLELMELTCEARAASPDGLVAKAPRARL